MLRAMGLPNPPKSGGLFKGDKAYAKHPQIYKEIKIKENPKAAALKRAPDEVIAKAIHEALSKGKVDH